MRERKEYCDNKTSVALKELGMPISEYRCGVPVILLYDAQMWLMEKEIYVAPRIYLFHDINLDEDTSWECTMYVAYRSITVFGKSLTYHEALELGIKEGIKVLEEDRNAKKI